MRSPLARRNPDASTEVTTFFGPPESPLFGVLHLPTGDTIRDAVLMCGSLGKEGSDAGRLQRIMATDLARRGFAVLRFDYLGTGDSAYSQIRDDALHNWSASIEHAVDYMKRGGATSTSVIAMRAGCLILNEFLAQRSHRFERVVCLDPVTSGRRFLREQTTLLRLSAGAHDDEPGTVRILGAALSKHTATALAATRLTPIDCDRALYVTRSAPTGADVRALIDRPGTEHCHGALLEQSTQSGDMVVALPLQAAGQVVTWLDRNTPSAGIPFALTYSHSVLMPVDEAPGSCVLEHIEEIGPRGLFGIRCAPAAPAAEPARTTVFCNTANDCHTGPNREWVELSRHLAAMGGVALRWDRAGRGDSGPVVRRQWTRVYSRTGIREVRLAARHACSEPAKVQVVGICSGSWQAAHAGRAGAAQRVILVNPMVWNWRVSSTLAWDWNAHRLLRATVAGAPHDADAANVRDPRASRLTARVIDTTRPLRTAAMSLVRTHTPPNVVVALARLGLGFVPQVVLDVLVRRGLSTTVLLAPHDAEFFDARGGRAALSRYRAAAKPPRLVRLADGDHAAYHHSVVHAIRHEVLRWHARSETGRMPDHRVPRSSTPENGSIGAVAVGVSSASDH